MGPEFDVCHPFWSGSGANIDTYLFDIEGY